MSEDIYLLRYEPKEKNKDTHEKKKHDHVGKTVSSDIDIEVVKDAGYE